MHCAWEASHGGDEMKWKPRETRFAWQPIKCRKCGYQVWLEPYYPAGPGEKEHPDWRRCCPCYAGELLTPKSYLGSPVDDMQKYAALQNQYAKLQQRMSTQKWLIPDKSEVEDGF